MIPRKWSGTPALNPTASPVRCEVEKMLQSIVEFGLTCSSVRGTTVLSSLGASGEAAVAGFLVA